ncbi:putative 2OG-Fe(II) oxygenase [Sphingomonas sp. MMS24-J45]|uniref:putative 2OG-Fe(II) oxygenase n=1 Tax=Sphingomonas sp. MMS24-J45 TaxID=3238806 RepID=UPI00384C2FC1
MRLFFPPAQRFTVASRHRLAEAQLEQGLLDRAGKFALAALRREAADARGSVALIEQCQPQDAREWMMLGSACLEVREPAYDGRALAAFARALASEGDDTVRLRSLLGSARALMRQDKIAEAERPLAAAVALAPMHGEAAGRYGRTVARSDPDRAVDWLSQQIAAGNRCAAVLESWAGALAAAGRRQQAEAATGLDQFLRQSRAVAPPGWSSLDAFHAALAEELADHPARRPERLGSASVHSVRIDEPHLTGSRHMAALESHLETLIVAHLDSLDGNHPFLRARPAAARVRYWVLLSHGEGHQIPHAHPAGWLSGVYYLSVPEVIAGGSGSEGCLQFVLPERVSAPGRAIEGPTIRPQSGLFVTFPSHAHHRTFPYTPALGDTAPRIVVAFDLEHRDDG